MHSPQTLYDISPDCTQQLVEKQGFSWSNLIHDKLLHFLANWDTDRDVDGDDLTIWEAAFGSGAVGDTDRDGDSDGADFLTWQREYTGPGAAAAGAVPEPSTSLLLLVGVAILGFSAVKGRPINKHRCNDS